MVASSLDTGEVDTEATLWFARLRASDCTPTERKDFERWRTSDSRHAAAYEEVARTWSSLSGLGWDPEIARWREDARQSVAYRTHKQHWLSAAAALVVCAIGAVFFMSPDGERFVSAHGEQRTVALSDGSRLTLNTDTEVRVDLGGDHRSVRLIRGEALFDVIHDANRPFSVRAGEALITDLGTRFDVHLNPGPGNPLRIAVLQGRVQITGYAAHSVVLTAGQQIPDASGTWQAQQADVAVVSGWTRGRIVLHDVPLEDALREANRYGEHHLVLADPSLQTLRVTGDFKVGQEDSFVRALCAIFPVRIEHRGEQWQVRRRD